MFWFDKVNFMHTRSEVNVYCLLCVPIGLCRKETDRGVSFHFKMRPELGTGLTLRNSDVLFSYFAAWALHDFPLSYPNPIEQTAKMNKVSGIPAFSIRTIFSTLTPIAHLFNPLTPEINPSAQRCLTRFLLGILLLEPCISLTYMRENEKNATIIYSVY
jgi:hypothetical protein